MTTSSSGNNTNKQPSVVFFGSGPVAAESLELLQRSFKIEAVVTKPRPPHHKGSVPVLELAQRLHLPTILAANKQELSSNIAEQNFVSKAAILIDFGIIARQDVIDHFPLGIVNSHFSLLPQLRGADPIAFAVLSGQKQTGVSLMLLVEAMDEGPLLAQAVYDVKPDETTPSLTHKLILLSDSLLKDTVPTYISGAAHPETGTPIKPTSQTDTNALRSQPLKTSYSRKLTKQDGQLDFSKPATQLEREIRAFIDWPKSHATLADKIVTITKAHALNNPSQAAASVKLAIGTASIIEKELLIQTGDGILVIDKLKPAGKAEMAATAFINGYGAELRH